MKLWPFRTRDDRLLIDDLRRAVESLEKKRELLRADIREKDRNIQSLEGRVMELRHEIWAVVQWSGLSFIEIPQEVLYPGKRLLLKQPDVSVEHRTRMIRYMRDGGEGENAKHKSPETLLRPATQAPTGREGGGDQEGGGKADGGDSPRSIPRGPFKPRGFA